MEEGRGHGAGHFGLRLHHACAHLLLKCDRHGAALLCLCLRNLLVCIRLVNLQFGADVLADVHIGNIDGEDLVRGARIETARQDVLRDVIRVFEHVLMSRGGPDGADHAFANPRDDGLFPGAPDQAIEIRADGDA